MRRYDVLIVGTGHGGAQAAASLRQLKFAGTVALIGEENHLPYERPPLSKDYLAGIKPFERLLIRPATFWPDRGIDVLMGQCVSAVQPGSHTVSTAGGETIGYGALIWAAGGNPRRLACEGHDLRRMHVMRNVADVDRMKDELGQTERVVVVGAGYIGLESAAVLSKLGKHVTVLEAQTRVLARVAGPALSRFYEAEHRAQGVDIRTCAAVDAIAGRAGDAVGVRLADGTVLPADLVVVGIGIEPAVAPLLLAGATGTNGVEVDEHLRTTLPDVFAIGDCALQANRHTRGARMRIESVQNAVDGATAVARFLLGQKTPYDALPWFWSNQYDLKLQTLGLSVGYDEEIVRGDLTERSFSIVYRRYGRVIALDCVNAVADYVQGKTLLHSEKSFAAAVIADHRIPLKELA